MNEKYIDEFCINCLIEYNGKKYFVKTKNFESMNNRKKRVLIGKKVIYELEE